MSQIATLLNTSASRIAYLDGLRGVAILAVVFYHAFSRWHWHVPYGSLYRNVPVFEYGWLGVQLFFMISGFVILMSLEKSNGFAHFMVKRWVRLFPAMLVCSLLIFTTTSFFHERPMGQPEFRDLLPGLTLIEPYFWELLIGSPQGQLEGTFWSIYVEIKLYIVAGLCFFILGWRQMIAVMTVLFLVGTLVLYLDPWLVRNELHTTKLVLSIFSGRPCGWFATGALFYRYSITGNRKILGIAMIWAIAVAFGVGKSPWNEMPFEWARVWGCLVVVGLFTLATTYSPVRGVMGNRILLLIGFASYPLYLLHDQVMISMINKINGLISWMPVLLMPLLPLALVLCIAWLIARFVEPVARFWLRKALCDCAAWLKAKRGHAGV